MEIIATLRDTIVASPTDVKEVVREKYGQGAQRVRSGQGNGCC